MVLVDLLPLGCVEEEVLTALEGCIGQTFGLQARRLTPLPAPGFAYDPGRRQFGSTEILRQVFQRLSADDALVLAVSHVDLFIPMLTFVFGQAQLDGRAALISLARLRQEFYGLPPNPSLLLKRAAKAALHELGHSLGLVHCLDPACVISVSTHIRQVDTKKQEFCLGCASMLAVKLSNLRARTQIVGLREEQE